MRKRWQATLGACVLAAVLLAFGTPMAAWSADSNAPSDVADNLSPDSPMSHPAEAAPSDTDKFNSEFHQSFQNIMPDAPPPGYSTMMGKWTTTLYGFVQFDTVYDSSNSFNNWPFNAGAASAGTVQGGGDNALGSTIDHNAWAFDVNNSRIGFALSSPVYHGYKLRALLEMDFLANPGETQYGGAAAGSAGSGLGYFTNPIFRIRHFFMDITTPSAGNFLFGQYWSLFGWQPYNIYSSVQIAPAPGTLYGRFPQARWYKIFHATDSIKIEPAISVQLPPIQSVGLPAFVEGVKIADSDWMGESMIGDTGKGQFPLALGFSAIQTDYSGYDTVGTATAGYSSWTSAEAVDLWLPIIPVKDGKPGNNLTLTAEYTWGQGDGYQFPNLNWGMGGSALSGTSPVAGVGPTGEGVLNGTVFMPLDIQTYNVVLQYYFPDDAHTSISLGFAVDNASNLTAIYNMPGGGNSLGGAGSANGLYKYLSPWNRNTYSFANVWHDFTPAVRAGLEYGQYDTLYTNGMAALDNRVMMSWFYFF